MRFKLMFDKELISNHFIKSWFVIEKQASSTLDVMKKIAETFGISCDIHLELEEFLIPEQQVFDKIVQEGEIVNVRKGKVQIFSQSAHIKTGGYERKKSNALDLQKSAKKVVKDEDSSSSEEILVKRRKSSSSERICINGKKPMFLSESEDSSSENKPKPTIKPLQTRVPIKSIHKPQPEPEFTRKSVYEFKVQEFINCNPQDLEVSDEIIYKTLEIRDDSTPGLSEHKLGRVMEVTGEQVTIQLLRDGLQEEFNQLDETEVFDELYLENFRVTLGKNMLIDLMKKPKKIHT